MQVSCSPSPFYASRPYFIAVSGGTPPYEFVPLPSPPNPPGVEVTSQGPPARVVVPADTPPGTPVYVDVSDSSGATVTAANTVA